MIKKIVKTSKFGIFRDFCWDSSTPDFKKFNLIYGWNKSGKTTLSRIFSSCEKKSIEFVQYPKDGEFEIVTETGSSVKHSGCKDCTLQVKVFNKDFVDDNVSFDPTNPSNPIVYVSEEDIESSKRLKELKDKIPTLGDALQLARKEKTKCESAETKFRVSTAQIVKTTVGSMQNKDKYYAYDKASVKKKIESVGVDNFKKLDEVTFDTNKNLINSEAADKQTLFSKYSLSFSHDGKIISSFSGVYEEVASVLSKKIVAETIERLKNDPDLNSWVQRGFDLHKTKEEKDKCLFCQNNLGEGFLESLAKHFSDDYGNLQKEIVALIPKIDVLKKNILSEANEKLYPDLQTGYTEEIKKLNITIKKINDWIDVVNIKLQEKSDNPMLTIDSPEEPEEFATSYNQSIKILNGIITKHNTQSDNHTKEVGTAKEVLESHLIANAIDDLGYKKTLEDFVSSIKSESDTQKLFDDNNSEISVLEKKTSNIGGALRAINEHLEDFFGRKEIELELDNTKKGYVIKRDGDIATNLSEGERNAIAFSYFIVKTSEKGSKISDTIIVVDDPISSFDSNFIYHSFSLIKNHFKDAKQLFISTHNFEFFNLIKDWLEQKNSKVESSNKKLKDGDKKPLPAEFFMIENVIKSDKRCAAIKPLEETLRRFRSEYHFLFARLNQFTNDTSPNYADFYTIGNIARRFLEIYVNFKIPTTGDLASKVGKLNTPTVSVTDKDKVYKLINEFSHGLDPATTIQHKDKSESQTAIKILMKMVEESDKNHYDSLLSNLS